MKRLLLAVAGLAAMAATSASAADMPPSRSLPLPRAPAYVPFFTWNGFYVGINAGYGFGHSNWTDTLTQDTTGNFNIKGALVGGTVGYNLQFGSFVFGLEGDYDWSNIKGPTTNCFGTCQTANHWLGTARGRIGYAFDRFLPYVTGGAAFGDVEGTFVGIGSFKTTKVGWTGGAGIEYAFIDNWSAKIEYLYVDLGKTTCDAACAAPAAADPVSATFKSNVVRAGVNYKF
jgi:outer membrane immunogenic protein